CWQLRHDPASPERAAWEPRLQELLAGGVQPCVPVLTNSVGMRFALIPPGSFLMGSPNTEKGRGQDEGPVHEVQITRPFCLGLHPVMQAEYEAGVGENPSFCSAAGAGADLVVDLDTRDFPVEMVSWFEAMGFCALLSSVDAGRVYRLPSEAEWEYAC